VVSLKKRSISRSAIVCSCRPAKMNTLTIAPARSGQRDRRQRPRQIGNTVHLWFLRGLSWDRYLTAKLEVVSAVRENLPTPNSRGGSDSRFPEQFWNVISTSPVEQGFTADCGRFLAQRPDSEEKGQAAVCPLSSPSDGGSFPTTSQLFPGRVQVVVPSWSFLDLPQDVLAHAFLDQSGQAILVILDH